jgi:hypothetical protein
MARAIDLYYDAHVETEPVLSEAEALSVVEGEAEGDLDLQLQRPCRDGRPSGGPGVSGRIAALRDDLSNIRVADGRVRSREPGNPIFFDT